MTPERPPKQHPGRDKLADLRKLAAKFQDKLASGGGTPAKRTQLKAKVAELKRRIAETEGQA